MVIYGKRHLNSAEKVEAHTACCREIFKFREILMQLLPHVEWSGSDAYVHLIYVKIAEICRYRSEIGLVNSFDATVSTLASINLKFIVPAIGVVKVDSFLN